MPDTETVNPPTPCWPAQQHHIDWIGLRSVLRPLQHSIGYMGDGFYRSKDPTNSIEVLKEKAAKENNTKKQSHRGQVR